MDAELFPDALVREVRPVPIGTPAGMPLPAPVDLRVRGGMITEVGVGLTRATGELVHDGGGRPVVPGLWDHHVHLGVWSASFARVDMSGTADPDEVLQRLRTHLATLPDPGSVVIGFGHRSAQWSRPPTVAELDTVSGTHPVVLVSGDAHNGWLNSAALRLLQAPPVVGALVENDWFPVFSRVGSLPGVREATEAAYHRAVAQANAAGVVGIGDMEFGPAHRDWPARFASGVRGLRVRAATYREGLDEVIAAGLHTGTALPGGHGLLRMGPLKIISDGSLNTRSAYCCQPYADGAELDRPCGWPNLSAAELAELLGRARDARLTVAVHAIGDAAVAQALDAFAATGARGVLEHAQLVAVGDPERMARLGVAASVQPAHLLDDRDVTMQCWPDRADRCFPLRTMLHAGVQLRLGSDAPVSPLDPWLAMAAAVHRSSDQREPWNPSESLTVAEALAASTDGQGTLGVGSRADLVLLDEDPLAPTADTAQAAAQLRAVRPVATLLAGRLVHSR